MTEQMNVPKLRFRDFSEGFSVTPLSEIISKLESGVSVNSEDVPPKSNEYGILKTSAIYAGNFIPEQAKLITDESELQRAKLNPKKDSIIISRMNTPALVGESGYVSKDYPNLFIPDRLWQATISTKYSARWLSYLLTSPRTRFIISSKGTGTSNSMKNISKPSFLSINVATPALPEQQKIASFLSKVDEKIALLAEKKDKLAEYKKGVMQQLFNGKWEEQDGQLTFVPPTLRFKADDGSEFSDWVEKTLGDVSEPPSYGLNSAATKYDGVNKYIRITDIDEDDRSFSPSPLTSPEEVNDAYLLEEGDIVFARTGASVGKSYLYNKDDGRLMFAGFLIKFSVSKANPKFISYQMTTSQYKHWVKVMSVRSGQPGINAQEYSTYSLNIPCTEEQEQIANFLSALDHKIDLLSSELEKAKEWKKGLLQQMFV